MRTEMIPRVTNNQPKMTLMSTLRKRMMIREIRYRLQKSLRSKALMLLRWNYLPALKLLLLLLMLRILSRQRKLDCRVLLSLRSRLTRRKLSQPLNTPEWKHVERRLLRLLRKFLRRLKSNSRLASRFNSRKTLRSQLFPMMKKQLKTLLSSSPIKLIDHWLTNLNSHTTLDLDFTFTIRP